MSRPHTVIGVKIRSRDHTLAPLGAVECGPRRKPWDEARDVIQAAAAATEGFVRHLTRLCRPSRGLALNQSGYADPIAFAMGHILAPLPGLKSWHDFLNLTPMHPRAPLPAGGERGDHEVVGDGLIPGFHPRLLT